MKKNIVLVSLAALFTLCLSHPSKAQSLTAITQEIAGHNARYFQLFANKDTAIVNLYTTDAGLLPPNAPPVRGRAALIKDFKTAYADTNLQGVKFTTQNLYGSGAGYIAEEGTWQVFGTNGKVMDKGKYLKLWRKTKDGWKIFRDIFNGDGKG